MLVQRFPSHQSLIQCLNITYGIVVSHLTYLPLGADRFSATYKAQTHHQESFFIKIKHPNTHAVGVTIAKLLSEVGIKQIILPIQNLHGQDVSSIDDFILIVYPFIEGDNGFHRELTSNQWLMLGQTLRQIHQIKVPLSIQKQIRRESYSNRWREAVRSLWNQMEESNNDEIAQNLVKFMKENERDIHRLVDRAEQLSQQLKNLSIEYVLCHSDIHGGNVLIEGEKSFYIVDWDDPIMAPKERDLMFIGGGVANVWNKPHEVEIFYRGYGFTEVNKTLLAYYRHERIVEDIADYSQGLLFASGNKEDRPIMYQQFIGMFEPQGVVDIAFKTDDY